jgi:uncharacterized damage-inducible protein DinB
MFEHGDYDANYQQYLDWKSEMEDMAEAEVEEEWQRQQGEERIMNEWKDFMTDIDLAQKIVEAQKQEEEKTTGEKIVEEAQKQEKECGCSYFDGACDHQSSQHGIDGTQCDCSDCTFDYGYCACGCGGDAIKHTEWVKEQVESFVQETLNANTAGGESAKTFMIDEEEEEKPSPSRTSSESRIMRDERFCEDLKIATATGLIAVFFGMYLGRYTCC